MKLSLSHWYHGSGVCFIVSIPDLCPLSYLDRVILLLCTRFVHVTSRIHQKCVRIVPYFLSNCVYALAFLRIYSYAPDSKGICGNNAKMTYCSWILKRGSPEIEHTMKA